MKREPGFYWVLVPDGWIVGNYYLSELTGAGFWALPGLRRRYQDDDFTEIDERKIVKMTP